MKKINITLIFILFTYPLIAQEYNIIYSFATNNHKIVQLISNKENDIFIFRLLIKNRILMEVKDNLRDNNIIFTVNGYHRGGGFKNAAMDYNNIIFKYKGIDYDIYYVWSISEEKTNEETDPIFGLKVIKDGIEINDMRGCKIITGEVYGWSFYDILPENKDE